MIHLHSQDSKSSLSEYEPGQIQPNAIDLRLDKVYKILNNPFVIDEHSKQHRGSVVYPTQVGEDGGNWWHLRQGVWEVVMQGTITMGEGEAGWVITRSTLNRNGVFLTSGLYDSGYKGIMAAAMHVFGDNTWIKEGTRIGQFLLFKSETLKLYDGSYGIGTDDDQIYKEGRP